MLQVSQIIENKEKIIKGLEKKRFQNAAITIEKAVELDRSRRETQVKLDAVLADANSRSKEIGVLMKDGRKEEAEKAKVESAELKTLAKQLGQDMEGYEKELHDLLLTIPNVPHELVPEGASPEHNEIVAEGGIMPTLPPDAKPHWELIEQYDIIDFALGNKITGAGFPVYKGKGARLQRALINFFLDEALKAGYVEIQPPIVVNEDSGYGTGQLPDKEGQMYPIANTNMYLIPTAEVPITNLYRNVILTDQHLPVKNVAYTPCFRSEAGSWGAHVRGLNRLHQFDKVEIVQVQKSGNSYQALDEMVNHVRRLLEKLELPFRIVRLCGGEMGFTSSMTYDMEVYSAAQDKWLEVSSVSNFETFQSNRLKLRYKKDQKSKPELLHTLNGSALALPRIVAALLENNQTTAGIVIPEALVKYTGFEIID
jgi:seryl-tRNA synthetase